MEYATRDTIEMTLHIQREGVPLSAAYSVSVTDMSAVAEHEDVPDITSLNEPFKATNAELVRVSHPVEHSLSLQGTIQPSPEKSRHTITTILVNSRQAVETEVVGSKFHVPLDFYDTTTAILKSQGRGGVHGRVEVVSPPKVVSFDLPAPLAYRYANEVPYNYPVSGREVTVLREIMVGAKPIPNPGDKFVSATQRRLGLAYQVFQGGQLESTRLVGDLAEYLLTRAPQFRETYCLIAFRQACGTSVPGARTFQSDNPTTSSLPGGVPNTVYTFFLNGHPLSALDFDLIPANSVSRIEIYWDPNPYFIKSVAIYTELMFPYWKEDIQRFKVRGYDRPSAFSLPPSDLSIPDYRATLYWKPDGHTGENEPGTFSFAASDVDGTYKVTVEGMTDEGDTFRVVRYISITR
jgi:hypothetical protein